MSEIELPRISLKFPTPPGWVEAALSDFDSFLVDHAACERKASATALMFVVRYPDRTEITEAMIQLSREELMHFHQVWRILQKRGQRLGPDHRTHYVNSLLKLERMHRDFGFLDRLLIFGIVEARGCERFAMIGENHPEQEYRDFYRGLAEAEERHHDLFLNLAFKYFTKEQVLDRLEELLIKEAEIIQNLPHRASVH